MESSPFLSTQFVDRLNELPADICDQKYCVIESVFNETCINTLTTNYNKKISDLRPAKIGKDSTKGLHVDIRNDSMAWLDNGDEDFAPVWSQLETLSLAARKELYLPIKRYEAQIALFAPGNYYKRHADRHKAQTSRILTMVLYFNEWSKGDGGELVLYPPEASKVIVEPKKNTAIVFLSEVEHEVLPTHKDRKSLTAWLRDDLDF